MLEPSAPLGGTAWTTRPACSVPKAPPVTTAQPGRQRVCAPSAIGSAAHASSKAGPPAARIAPSAFCLPAKRQKRWFRLPTSATLADVAIASNPRTAAMSQRGRSRIITMFATGGRREHAPRWGQRRDKERAKLHKQQTCYQSTRTCLASSSPAARIPASV